MLIAAGDALVAWAYDIATHEADGHRWDRTPHDDAMLMAAQLGWLLSATSTTLDQALAWYMRATENARRRPATMSPAGFHRSFVLAGDNHFSPLSVEQRARLEQRYRDGPDIHEAILDAVAPLASRRILEVGAGAGRLAARLAARVGARVVAADSNAAFTADADARGVEAVVADVTDGEAAAAYAATLPGRVAHGRLSGIHVPSS